MHECQCFVGWQLHVHENITLQKFVHLLFEKNCCANITGTGIERLMCANSWRRYQHCSGNNGSLYYSSLSPRFLLHTPHLHSLSAHKDWLKVVYRVSGYIHSNFKFLSLVTYSSPRIALSSVLFPELWNPKMLMRTFFSSSCSLISCSSLSALCNFSSRANEACIH